MPQPDDQTRERHALTLTRVLKALESGGVDYVICGGVACIMQGVNRVTADLDIAVRLERDNLARLIEVVRDLHLQPRIPEPLESLLDERRREQWIEQKHAQVFTLVSPSEPLQIDVFLKYPIPFDDLRSRANVMVGQDVTLRVSCKDDLITAKRAAGREQDLSDVRDLERLLRDEQQRQARS